MQDNGDWEVARGKGRGAGRLIKKQGRKAGEYNPNTLESNIREVKEGMIKEEEEFKSMDSNQKSKYDTHMKEYVNQEIERFDALKKTLEINRRAKIQCKICLKYGDHYTSGCIDKPMKRCFRCGQGGHIKKDCLATLKCMYCGKKPHVKGM